MAANATKVQPPFCTEWSCPWGYALKLDAANLRGHDAANCCNAVPEDVMGIMVKSAGWASGNLAEFHVNGERLSFKANRGLNVVVLKADGQPERMGYLKPQTFDTYKKGSMEHLTEFLDSLKNGTVVLIAVKDEAKVGLTRAAQDAIARCGGVQIYSLRWRASYALVGVKGKTALAEDLQLTQTGMSAVAVARHTVDFSAEPLKPVCQARVSNPPVRGWSANNNLELEAGCRYDLWEGANVADCLEGSWMLIIGGSNSVLMAVQLANMLSPEAIMPVRDGATMGGFTVVDVIVRGGRVIYSKAAKLDHCSALRHDAVCQAAIADLVAEAPVYNSSVGGIRVTLFEARFWDQADTALQSVIKDTRWTAAPLAINIQVSAWYIYCAGFKVKWCPRQNLTDPELTHAQGLALFQADMSPVVSKLETLCVEGGRAERHGCVVATNSWQSPPPHRLHYYNDYNALIAAGLAGKDSDILRIVDLWTLGQAFPYENILGHGSPFLNIWNWQVMLGGFCPPENAAEGTFAAFTGGLCFGRQASRVRISSEPVKFDLSPETGNECPGYWSTCPMHGGGHIRCEPWECANSIPCRMTAMARGRPVETNVTALARLPSAPGPRLRGRMP